MPFFNKNYTLETALEKIENAKALLANAEQKKLIKFLDLLQQRIDDFDNELKKTRDIDKRARIIEQYNQFAKTLYHCIYRPRLTYCYITNYLNFSYYPVGIEDEFKINPIRYGVSLSGTLLGAALILASFVAFAFNPLIGAILLPIGITMLTPACISLFTSDTPDTSVIKSEEKIIFQMGAQLKDPSVSLDDLQENSESIYRPTL
ncbi:MAG: hypothetical protein ACRCXC_06590 [Legionella sp.]